MNIRFITLLILTSAMLFFTSCEKENYDKIIYEDPNYDPGEFYENSPIQAVTSGNSDAIQLGCVQVNFPFSLQLENDQTLTVTTYAEFEAAVSSSEPVALDFEYPVEGVNHLGLAQTFNDALSLGRSFATCVPTKGWGRSQSSGTTLPAFLMTEYCIDLDYPVSLVDGQGNTYTAANESDFVKHSLAHSDLFFTLPLTVRYNQAITDITSLEKMFDAFSICNESNYMPLQEGANGSMAHPFDCFTFVFPFEVLIVEPDTISTIDDEDELVQLSLSGEEYEFIYPIDIEDEFGTTTTLNSDLGLIQTFVDCGVITVDTTPVDPCETEAHILLFYNGLNILTLNRYEYEMNYPITLIVEGNQVVLNSDSDYLPAIGGSPFSPQSAEIVYPVSITQFGRTLVFNSDQDVCGFYATLDEDCTNKPAHIQLFHNTVGAPTTCAFFVEYPMNLSRNGVQIQIQDRDDYLIALNDPGAYDELEIVYPVSVSKTNNGQQITFNSDGEICDYLESCF